MLFTEYNLISYLLTNCPPQKGGNTKPFLAYDDFEKNTMSIYEDNGIHRNNIFFVFESNDKGKYFLKQPKRIEQEFRQSVYTEANIYKYIPSEIRHLFPSLVGFDLAHFLLICNYIDGQGINFNDKDSLSLLASNLKIIHRSFSNSIEKEKQKFEDFLVSAKPFILRLDKATIRALKDGLILIDDKKVNEKVVNWLSIEENQTRLIDISTQWVENTIIHQDLKSNNILLDSNNASPLIKFIDWEMAVIGDAYWDLASIMAGFLNADINKLDLNNNFSSACKELFRNKAFIFKTHFINKYFEEERFYPEKLTAFVGAFILLKNTVLADTKHFRFAFEILENIKTYSNFFSVSEWNWKKKILTLLNLS